jgi:septal ring factor EnvC (AmiA/AmiB activator)
MPSFGQILDLNAGNENIRAPYGGVVRYAQSLGALGQVLLIDHGAGVATMFSSLGPISVDWGTSLDQGQNVAIVGASGLAFSKQVHVAVLIHGIPVDPGDWFDKKRYSQQIEGPLNGARQQFGIPIIRTGERL